MITALSDTAPNDPDLTVIRTGTITGPGFYCTRKDDENSATDDNVAALSYTTDTSVKISAWTMEGLRETSLDFSCGPVFEDLGGGLDFLTELSARLAPSDSRDLAATEAVQLIDRARDHIAMAVGMISAGKSLTSRPGPPRQGAAPPQSAGIGSAVRRSHGRLIALLRYA